MRLRFMLAVPPSRRIYTEDVSGDGEMVYTSGQARGSTLSHETFMGQWVFAERQVRTGGASVFGLREGNDPQQIGDAEAR